MRLTIELTTEESIALRRFSHANQPPTLEEAGRHTGNLKLVPSIDEDSQIEGTA